MNACFNLNLNLQGENELISGSAPSVKNLYNHNNIKYYNIKYIIILRREIRAYSILMYRDRVFTIVAE